MLSHLLGLFAPSGFLDARMPWTTSPYSGEGGQKFQELITCTESSHNHYAALHVALGQAEQNYLSTAHLTLRPSHSGWG